MPNPSLLSMEAGMRANAGGRYSGVATGISKLEQQKLQEINARRQENLKMREEAFKTIFESNPAAAYSLLGIDVPEGADVGAPGTPDGMRASKVTRTQGNSTFTYESPEAIDESFMMKEYLKYKQASDENNALFSRIKGYTPVQVSPYVQWVRENFPDAYTQLFEKENAQPQQSSGKRTIKTKQEAIELLKANGKPVTERNVQAVLDHYK